MTDTKEFNLNFTCRNDQSGEQLINVSYNWEVKDAFDFTRTRDNLNSFLASINSNLIVVYKTTEANTDVAKSKKS